MPSSSANLAHEIKPGGLCESTIASHLFIKEFFEAPFFDINVINDVAGAELVGALNNVVALAAGFANSASSPPRILRDIRT